MAMHTEKPVVFITGAAGGIGRHFAVSRRGQFRMMATDLDGEALRAALGEESESFLPMPHDVSRADQWEQALAACRAKFGRIDYLINNAGMLRPSFVLEAGTGHIEQHMDVNAKGVLLGTTLGAQAMREQGGGHIINIVSLAGISPVPGLAFYAASKFAARGFSLSAAMELKPHNIYVTSICPDAVKTAMYDLQLHTPKEAALTFSGATQPLTPSDVEKAILKAMQSRAMEIVIPAHRGWAAKLASAFPHLAHGLHRYLERKGLKRIEEIKRG